MKAFADDISNVAKMMVSLIDSVENTVGKGENPGLTVFSKTFFVRIIKGRDYVIKS